jgi:hypothetical protein
MSRVILFVVMSTPYRSVVKGAIVEFGSSDPVAVAFNVEFDMSRDIAAVWRSW